MVNIEHVFSRTNVVAESWIQISYICCYHSNDRANLSTLRKIREAIQVKILLRKKYSAHQRRKKYKDTGKGRKKSKNKALTALKKNTFLKSVETSWLKNNIFKESIFFLAMPAIATPGIINVAVSNKKKKKRFCVNCYWEMKPNWWFTTFIMATIFSGFLETDCLRAVDCHPKSIKPSSLYQTCNCGFEIIYNLCFFYPPPQFQ